MRLQRTAVFVVATLVLAASPARAAESGEVRLRLRDDAIARYSVDARVDSEMDLLGSARKRTLKVRYHVSLWPKGDAKDGIQHVSLRFDRIEGSVESATATAEFSRARGEPAGRPETVLVGQVLTLGIDERCGVRSVEGLRDGVSLGQLTPGVVREHVEAIFHRLPNPAPKVGADWGTTTSVSSNGLAFALDPLWQITAVDAEGIDVEQTGTIALDEKNSTLPLMQVADQLRTEGATLSGVARIARTDGLVVSRRTERSLTLIAEMSMGEASVRTAQVIDVKRLGDGDPAGRESTTGDPTTKSERSLPPHEGLAHGLGAKKSDVLKTLGEPDRSGERLRSPGTFATYKTHGFIYEFDENGEVVTLKATVWSDREPFAGTIHGVGLDDTIDTCLLKWGEPASRRRRSEMSSMETVEWHLGGVVLELEIWIEGGVEPENKREPPGHVRTIKLKR